MSDDLAVGGLLKAGQSVDVFVTAIVAVPAELVEDGQYYTDRSTKITYQDMVILAREGAFYIVRAPSPVAEEIAHLQAIGYGDVQHGPAARRGHAADRRHGARRDDQPDHREVRAADPRGLPDGSGPLRAPSPTASPSPTVGVPDLAASPSASPTAAP